MWQLSARIILTESVFNLFPSAFLRRDISGVAGSIKKSRLKAAKFMTCMKQLKNKNKPILPGEMPGNR